MVSFGWLAGPPAFLAARVQLTGFIRPMPVIKFIKEKKEIEVPRGANLREEAIKAGVNVYDGLNGFGKSLNKYLNCHGFGQCGMCRVLITKGMENTDPMGTAERWRFRVPLPTPLTPLALDPLPCLAFVGHEDTMRLACKTVVNGDIEVETGPPLDLFGENFFS
jgi:ferredoxin